MVPAAVAVGDIIETGLLTEHGEDGVQSGQAFQAGICSDGFIAIQQDFPDMIPDRYYGIAEVAFLPGIGRPMLAGYGIAIDVLA